MAEGSSCGFTAEELAAGSGSKKRKRNDDDVICAHCQKKGHSRRTHRDCGKYTGPRKKSNTQPQEPPLDLDADEADAMDSMPLEDAGDSDDDIFHDVGSWSDDEGIMRSTI